MLKALLIDNNDSFTINLEHLLVESLRCEVTIIPYSKLEMVHLTDYDMAVISPGPGKPAEYPAYARLFQADMPILGICLGMQIMTEIYGGEVSVLPDCFHGRTETIIFDGERFAVARYHSLAVSKPPDSFRVIAETETGIPMAIIHEIRPIVGYQFHPESFLTENGSHFIHYANAFFKTTYNS